MHSWAGEILTSGGRFLFSGTPDHPTFWYSPQPYWKLHAFWIPTTPSCTWCIPFTPLNTLAKQVDSTSGTQISLKFPQGENRNINEFNSCGIPPIFHLPVREKTVASDSAICNWPGFANAETLHRLRQAAVASFVSAGLRQLGLFREVNRLASAGTDGNSGSL